MEEREDHNRVWSGELKIAGCYLPRCTTVLSTDMRSLASLPAGSVLFQSSVISRYSSLLTSRRLFQY